MERVPTRHEITRHHDPDPVESPWVDGPPPDEPVAIVAPDPRWPARYRRLAEQIRAALGPVVLDLDHVGSTSVPGLAAKDVIDIDLTVGDPRDESAYVPALQNLGYRLTVREPGWHQHRCLRLDVPRANLHVFGPDCPEVVRHRMFRDWLRSHPDDRESYENAKRAAVPGGGHVMDYNARKQPVIREIYDRMFRAEGLL
ncbi:hypothetical protein LI99_10350 [Mycolicibacterium smegmatis]|uniref:GrpB domain protein n=3 Tax=Mycolicibacterium smegmatis TaxID=1772 RepID=I7FZC2_MYCS2|nr:conserved hypothetical protein [Mycolicibacterium smegmatis MC2 155]AIU13912.1 hypothetical protein LI99_10350 [Mycolicibacterium smegmatis]AWT53037.1 hypothetical protein D806_020550 [Mycolicibacterium smegmatis MKD8]AFP38502.1 GrpB domain protein [Mycolicibacterium smegmatis MC2 155]AIU07287.1 hypothetical protein LJ00_10350 [Mycolicibacterium smegmatis MC2 155]